MKRLITTLLLVICSASFSQKADNFWKKSSKTGNSNNITKTNLPLKHLFDLDFHSLKNKLASSPKRNSSNIASSTIISLPNSEEKMESFRVYENSVLAPELAEKYPNIKSYVAVGIDNPNARAYFSSSPLGFKSMTLYPNQSAVFIEPVTDDLNTYTIYKKSDREESLDKFECSVIDYVSDNTSPTADNSYFAKGADDAKLRTFRLALSCTAEYTAYFGGTKAGALAGMNNSMTRINGIFEKDFGLQLILIGNNDSIIYTDPTTDPYSDYTSKSNWRSELKSNLNTTIGLANYDIGHLFGAAALGGGGDAGCIGCICSDFNKGSGYTCANPNLFSGDTFDIDYVAHEMGHQLGANHTFTYVNDNSVSQMEPGSGSTIMGYAGCSSQNVQSHSDAYFHAISIQQVTDNIKSKACAVLISTGNAVPTVNAGLDYTIPMGTPFQLTGSATDANPDDVLTYTWEEMDLGNSTTSKPSATATTGPLFRSYTPNTLPTRYFPNINTILSGLTMTAGLQIPVESLPGVARTLNFRLTARDNRAGGAANNTDDMVITVDGNSGPFTVNSQNSAVTYTAGSTQTISWSVAGTNANGVNCSSVDILLSTDGGKTFPITLLSTTPNTGNASVILPNIIGNTNRIMVKGTNHIFFDVNNSNFTITNSAIADTIVPTSPTLSVSGTTTSGTNLSWTASSDNIGVVGYNVYQNGMLKTTTTASSISISGLSSSSTYNFYIKAKDAAGNLSVNSNTVTITTLTPSDTTAPTPSTLSTAGITTSSVDLSWTTATDNIGVTGYNVYQNGALKTSTTSTALTITGLSASTTYNFYVVALDAAGNLSANSNIVTVTTPSIDTSSTPSSETTTLIRTSTSYCTSNGNSTAKEYIKKIQIGTFSNASGNNNGYGNFTSLSADLTIGISNTIVITPAWNGSSVSESYRVWIDYNQDGDFDDSGEQVFQKSKTKATSISGNFTIPSTVKPGQTRIRISMKYNSFPNSCEIFSNGEVEDYTINIIDSTARPENDEASDNTSAISKLDFGLYPNPVKDDILHISNLEKPADYRIFNLMGQELESNPIKNNTIYVGYLKPGIYLIEVSNGTSIATKRFIKE